MENHDWTLECHSVLISFTAPTFIMQQPKSSVVGLLKEMITKFEEDPPLSSKATRENKDPHELLAFVSNFQISDGTCTSLVM